MTTNKKWKPELWDRRLEENFDLLSRLFIQGAKTVSDAYTVDADTDSVIIQTGASKVITLPTAAPANKGRAFLIQYDNATQAANMVDAAGNVIVVAGSIAQYDVFLCISMGDTDTGIGPNNGYTVVAFAGGAKAIA